MENNQMKIEIFKKIETAQEDFSNAVKGVEDAFERLMDKLGAANLPDHTRAPAIAENLINAYPTLPNQVREFLECIRDGRPYEQNVSNLALLIA